MITLYQYPTSPFCEKVRRALEYKGLEYEIHDVDRTKLETYAAISPAMKFPVIEHEGGTVFDSTNIAEYLDSKFPESPSLIPADALAAATAHVIEDWADESLYFYEMTMRLAWEHNCARRVVHEFVATMPPGITAEQALPLIVQTVGAKVAEQGIGKKPRETVVEDARRHFVALEAMLNVRDWLAGEAPSIADLAVIAQVNALAYAEEVEPMIDAGVRGWMGRVNEVAPDPRGTSGQ